MLSFIGQGYTKSRTPAIIINHFLRNPHIYTPYTPYQEEISQGRLELLYKYQDLICDITGFEYATCSLIDQCQVAMDIMMIMKNSKPQASTILIHPHFNSRVAKTIELRAKQHDINITRDLTYDPNLLCGVFSQNPDKFGLINQDIFKGDIIKACLTDIYSNFIYENPEKLGYDICFGHSGCLGVPIGYGGPQPAFIATSKKYSRLMPGRYIGKSIDKYNLEAYRLTWQTREQHIRREKATSNVCTSQALLAQIAVTYGLYHGANGLRDISYSIKDKIDYIGNKLNIDTNYNFDTFTVIPESDLYNDLIKNNIYGFEHENRHISFTFDETHDKNDINRLCDKIKNKAYFSKKSRLIKKRNSNVTFTSISDNELDLQRYLHDLSLKDYSLSDGMIPLGSCTMKHTSPSHMEKLFQDDYQVHPYISIEKTPYIETFDYLSKRLCELSGFDKIYYQGQSGAMGEYASLSTFKNYFDSKCEKRKYIIMPRSAHGTNASSASLTGLKVRYVDEKNGLIDIEHLDKIINEVKDELFGFMLTYPNTYGLFEPNIKLINEKIHKNGGLSYMDGANFNAIMGYQTSEELGFDSCHFNLHKTFAIPHGGGGPGMGPIGIREFLAPYLPKYFTSTDFGSASICTISEQYLRKHSNLELAKMAKKNIDTNKKVINELKDYYKILNSDSEYIAHEFIIDVKGLPVSENDICKRLIDYGFHPPTMSWPVSKSLMIEIVESESDEEIHRFITAMKMIKQEINSNPNLLKNAPHTQRDLVNWNYDYSIEKGCFPMGLNKRKYWPTTNRVDSVYGDRNF
ncbi:MAG: hypothetical protein CMF62_00250 [Magnetococcales bacterium]|nr:hypothetical protein [Magnetococcales bacterium]|tara:strand:+ start:23908 stop:26313 length:2406 start_codon:yes stop_codon:yes gene_type:complete